MITDTHREQAREIIRQLLNNIEPPKNNWSTGDHDFLSYSTQEEIAERIASALASRDTEVREVLSGLIHAGVEFDDERMHYVVMQIDRDVLATARALYAKLSNEPTPVNSAPLPKPSRRKSKQERIAEDLKNSDVMARMTDRDNIEYGPYDSLPVCGEHVARLGRKRG